jgi:hypothetical protein
MSLEALRELSALDAEVKNLLHRYDEMLLATRRRFLNKIIECFSGMMEGEGLKVIRDPMGATAKLDQTELVIAGTDPSHMLVDAHAKYTVTCSLAPNKVYGILLCRQPMADFTNGSSDTNDQITNKKLEIEYLKSMIQSHGGDQWYLVGRMENTAEIRTATSQAPLAQYDSFATFEDAMKTALREISNAAVAPRAS